jgi:hypothetical protein
MLEGRPWSAFDGHGLRNLRLEHCDVTRHLRRCASPTVFAVCNRTETPECLV